METWRKFPIQTCFSLYWAKFFPSFLWNKDCGATSGPENKHQNTTSPFCSRLIQRTFLRCVLVGRSTVAIGWGGCTCGVFRAWLLEKWVDACHCLLLRDKDGGKGTILHWQCYLLMGPNLPLGITLCHSGAGTASMIDWMLSYLDNIQFTVHYPLPISVFNVKKGPRKNVRQGSRRSGLLTGH